MSVFCLVDQTGQGGAAQSARLLDAHATALLVLTPSDVLLPPVLVPSAHPPLTVCRLAETLFGVGSSSCSSSSKRWSFCSEKTKLGLGTTSGMITAVDAPPRSPFCVGGLRFLCHVSLTHTFLATVLFGTVSIKPRS